MGCTAAKNNPWQGVPMGERDIGVFMACTNLQSAIEQILPQIQNLKTNDPDIDPVLHDETRLQVYTAFFERLIKSVSEVNSKPVSEYLQLDSAARASYPEAEKEKIREFVKSVHGLPDTCSPPDPFWRKVATSLKDQKSACYQMNSACYDCITGMASLKQKIHAHRIRDKGMRREAEDAQRRIAETFPSIAPLKKIIEARFTAGKAAMKGLSILEEVEAIAAKSGKEFKSAH